MSAAFHKFDRGMSESVTVVIAGEPVAKARPRATRRGFVYTPAHVRKYEAHGRLAAQQAMDGRPPIAVPVCAEITVDLPVPMSWSGKRRDAALRGEIRPTARPDVDNFVKAAFDSVNQIVLADDSLVVDLVATKRYAAVPALTITITPLPALTAQVGLSPAATAAANAVFAAAENGRAAG
jgi:Holliday junction resolvase RusA-like endonuclease